MATIVCHRTAETKDVGATQFRLYDIVDGQQRLTTLILLLKAIELALPESSEDRTDLAKVLVKRDGRLILLQTNNANEFNFNRFIREGVAPSPAEVETHSDRNLAAAIRECGEFVKSWSASRDILTLRRLILHRLGFVVFDTEDSGIVYTIFEVLNSRGLAVDWLDKTKSVLMGRMYELSVSTAATEAEIESLQAIWSHIYREIAKQDIPGEEILRITATLYYGPGHGKPRSAEESLDLLRKSAPLSINRGRSRCGCLMSPAKLAELYASPNLGPVTEILHARLLAVAIKSAPGVNDNERQKLLEQWERVTFRIFGLSDKDSRTKVGDYVRLAYRIVTEDIECRTYNQIMTGLRQLGQEYPIEEAIREGLVAKNFYDHPEECRYLLWSYEEHISRQQGVVIDEVERSKIWKVRAADSIEHIFPQNPSGAAWRDKMRDRDGTPQPLLPNVDRIGNLLLLPIQLNQEAQNYAFEGKKKTYAKYNLRMIQEVCKKDCWGLPQIESREERIVGWARTRWDDL